MIKEIMLVPFPRAASSRLISFLTFHISIYLGEGGCQLVCVFRRSRTSWPLFCRFCRVGLRSSPPRWRWGRSCWRIGLFPRVIACASKLMTSCRPFYGEVGDFFRALSFAWLALNLVGFCCEEGFRRGKKSFLWPGRWAPQTDPQLGGPEP